ncbi:MAG: PEP-CTERM sorting domain-containing protein [Acidobacteria bacterium]|nr:PEP-CTERM sorting domain-containing protein [Acidobacteriota bacterium]
MDGVGYLPPAFRVVADFTINALTPIVVPEGNPDVFTFSVQFNMSGGYGVEDGAGLQTISSGLLTGQGWAEVVLARGGSQTDGTPLYWARSATYHFTPAAVPEPATLALLGAGVAGLSATLRRKLRVR